MSSNFIDSSGSRSQKGSPALVCALLCVRNQVSHPYKTTDIILCFSAYVVKQQTFKTGDAALKRRGRSQFRVLCDVLPVLSQRSWCRKSNHSAYFPEREGSDVKLNTTTAKIHLEVGGERQHLRKHATTPVRLVVFGK